MNDIKKMDVNLLKSVSVLVSEQCVVKHKVINTLATLTSKEGTIS